MELKDVISYCIKKEIAFYCYRKPGMPIKTGIGTIKEISTNELFTQEKSGFTIMPFDSDEKGYYISDDYFFLGTDAKISESDLNNIEKSDLHKSQNNVQINQKDFERQPYMARVQSAIDTIKKGGLSKVVYSHPEYVTGDKTNEVTTIMSRLMSAYPHAYIAIVNLPGYAIWICATPELLLSRKGQNIQTNAIAGTRKVCVSGTPWDEKNKEEQQIVEKFIIDTLKHDCTSITALPVCTSRAGHLEHLQTRINAKMPEDQSAVGLITRLHPTPAVCGMPKEAAKANLRDHENYNREMYSGYLGHITSETHFSFFVNLRCLKMTKEGTILYAGGGITHSSDPLTEWEETKMKIETLKRHLS